MRLLRLVEMTSQTGAAPSGINSSPFIHPNAASLKPGRTISPVSGVVVAVAGMAKISFEVVKRTSVPVIVIC